MGGISLERLTYFVWDENRFTAKVIQNSTEKIRSFFGHKSIMMPCSARVPAFVPNPTRKTTIVGKSFIVAVLVPIAKISQLVLVDVLSMFIIPRTCIVFPKFF